MFKNLNRTFLVCMLLIGTCSSVFGIDMSQAFTHAQEQSVGIDSIFKGKSTVSNLFSKALKLVKDTEVTSSVAAFDQLKEYYKPCTLDTIDFINILYRSNSSFRNTFLLILPKRTKTPTSDNINKSYKKFFICKKITNPTPADADGIDTEINTKYLEIYPNIYSMSTINKDNFGSDLFWNGTKDDSDFDLLYDINQIGKILFENIQDSPEILFYKLPKSPTASNASSSSTQSAYQLGGGGGSFPGTISSSTPPSSSSGGSSGGGSFTPTPTIVSSQTQNISINKNMPQLSDDQEVQNFVDSTKPVVSSSPAGVALVFGNQCLVSETPPPVEEVTPLMTSEEYISGINAFIDNASVNDVINTHLLKVFTKKTPLPLGGSTSDSGYADTVANTYAEQAFGDAAPGTCEYACNTLPLDQQAQCQFSCASSCTNKCNDTRKSTQGACATSYTTQKAECEQLSSLKKAACLVSAVATKTSCITQISTDEALCLSDCMCFLVAGPNGAGWEKVEDMFSIKFCKVPVQTKTVTPGKKVFSIQAIFQEISDVLAGLRDSGQMVKFAKTKEFLDGNVKIKFADNFAFKLLVGFKPVFTQKSTTIKNQEQTQANVDLNTAILDMNIASPEADDPNKYVIVSDYITNNANLEPTTSLEDINKNIQKFQAAATAAKATKLSNDKINAIIDTYAQQKTPTLFVQNMIQFLGDNQLFLQNLSDALLDMNKMSLELKTKIESSK
ncbi:MAG: hypothetical protein NT085_05200 [candidate division SR1 bacterium]|nr:hypothetical protein [candidate division SR1 bacterium]